jgi:hypothetical protein
VAFAAIEEREAEVSGRGRVGPGDYSVRLTANGASETQPLILLLDPLRTEAEEGEIKLFFSKRYAVEPSGGFRLWY